MRNHQGIGNEFIATEHEVGAPDGRLKRRERLGGLLNYYCRRATRFHRFRRRHEVIPLSSFTGFDAV